jgi:hypothetical protein
LPLFRRHEPAVNAHTSLRPPGYGGPQRARSVRPKSKIAALLKRQLAICAVDNEDERTAAAIMRQAHSENSQRNPSGKAT